MDLKVGRRRAHAALAATQKKDLGSQGASQGLTVRELFHRVINLLRL
jgi:hypothetical protein